MNNNNNNNNNDNNTGDNNYNNNDKQVHVKYFNLFVCSLRKCNIFKAF